MNGFRILIQADCSPPLESGNISVRSSRVLGLINEWGKRFNSKPPGNLLFSWGENGCITKTYPGE